MLYIRSSQHFTPQSKSGIGSEGNEPFNEWKQLFTPCHVRELGRMNDLLAELVRVALKGIHYKSIVGEEVHAPHVVDDLRLSDLRQFEKLFTLKLHTIGT